MSMHHSHHSAFIGLSLLIAVLGSWTALDLFRRVRSHVGRAQRVWLGAAAIAMGFSIWSMHFVAMLGFDPGSPVSYDLGLTFLSLVLAIGATCGAFFVAARERAAIRTLWLSGAAMGAGICLMHYVGMAALRTTAVVGYRPSYVAASFAIAVGAATAALFAARVERSWTWRGAAAVILGMAIAGMHYTAMAGLTLTPIPGAMAAAPGAPPLVLGFSVAAGALMILFLALLASLYDQRLNVLFALEAGRIGYWELALPERTLHISGRGREVFGRDPTAPFSRPELLAMLQPDDAARCDAALDEAIATGTEYDAEYLLELPGQAPRWVNIRGRVVASAGGRPRRMAGVVLDVTERRRAFQAVERAEMRQRLLIDELNHRVKNTLSTVQSIARQTAKSALTPEDFNRAFESRLLALSQTHNALTRGAWVEASLRELLEQEFSPYSPDQVRLEGPDISLRPQQAVAMGMVFHELATNAAKHGALSQTSGCVSVHWRRESPERLLLDWFETGGPTVLPPTRQGFGSRLLRAAVEGELSGAASFSYPQDGFQAHLRLILEPNREPERNAA